MHTIFQKYLPYNAVMDDCTSEQGKTFEIFAYLLNL